MGENRKKKCSRCGIVKFASPRKHSLQAGDSDSPDNNNLIATINVKKKGKY